MKRAFRAAGAALATALLFVCALVLALALHLDTKLARRLAVTRVNEALGAVLEGKITVGAVSRLTLEGLDGASVRVDAPDGTQVLRAEGVRARVSVLGIARSALGGGPLRVDVSDVRVDSVDVSVDADASGVPKIARAFVPRPPAPPAKVATGPSRKVALTIARVTVNHAWAHGLIPGAPPIDVDLDQVGAVAHVLPEQISIDVSRLVLRARGLPHGLDPAGECRAHLAMPSSTGTAMGVDGSFDGDVGGFPLAIRAAKDGTRIDASVDAPRLSSAKLRELFPSAPVQEDGSARLEAHGDLPHLDLGGDVEVGKGAAHLAGEITLGDETRARATVSAQAIDVRAFSTTGPTSALAATLSATVTAKGGAVSGDYTLDAAAGTVGAATVPSAKIDGSFTRAAATGLVLRGKGRVLEEGAPVDVTFTLHPDGASSVIDVTARVNAPRLDRVRGVPAGTGGSADATASGKIRLSSATVDATVDADLRDVLRGTTRIARGHVRVRATGPLASPTLDTTMTVEDLEASGYKFTRGEATARGRGATQHVELSLVGADSTSFVRGRADIDAATTTARNVEVDVTREHERLAARVAELHLANGEVRVDGAVVEGLGTPARAEVRVTRDQAVVRMHAKAVSLARVARWLGSSAGVAEGRVDFDVDLVVDRKGATGHVLADASHATIGNVKDLGAHIDATFEGHRCAANVHATLGAVGYADLKTTNLTFAEGPLTVDAWRKGWGRVDVDAKIDLAELYATLAPGTLPIAGMSGELTVTAKSARNAQTDFTPELGLTAKTEKLTVTRKAGEVMTGVDAALDLKVDGDSGAAQLKTELVDQLGTIASLDASSDAIPYRQLLDTDSDVPDVLSRTPFSAKIAVPLRVVAKLPAMFDVGDTRGEVEATIDFEGSVRAPKVQLLASAFHLYSEDSPLSLPLEIHLVGSYDGSAADFTSVVRSPKESLVESTAHVAISTSEVLTRPAGAPVPWSGAAHVRLLTFPLASIEPVAERGVRGNASGDITVAGVNEATPSAKVQVNVAGLQVGATKYTNAKIDVAMDTKTLRASARVDQTDGYAQATLQAGVTWVHAVPSLDATQHLDAALDAKGFRAAGLLPLVDTSLTELDGRIDANARAAIEPKTNDAKLSGTILLSGGLFEIAATGTELHDAKAKITLVPDGTVRLEDASARGVTGMISASAVAHLQGLRLADAKAEVKIPKGKAIPLDVAGAQMGDIYGEATLTAKSSLEQRLLNVDVDVPSLHVTLPLAASHAVTDRDELPNVHVGVYTPDRFVPLAIDGRAGVKKVPTDDATLVVSVRLHEDVEIARGTTLRVALDGNPVIRVQGATTVSGQVRLRSGSLDVQGKKFEIEQGTVTFQGTDPSNPLVVVTAGWTASDGTRVFADFAGPLKTGKVTLRSEPSRPQDEILTLIIFGTTDSGSAGGQGAGTATAAGSAAGGFATEGLSRGLDELTGLQVSTKIDTTNAQNPRPEVEVQIARSISLQIAFVLGTPPPGMSPDTTFATIDWRFLRQWSLATTFGNVGSSFADVIWQYRY